MRTEALHTRSCWTALSYRITLFQIAQSLDPNNFCDPQFACSCPPFLALILRATRLTWHLVLLSQDLYCLSIQYCLQLGLCNYPGTRPAQHLVHSHAALSAHMLQSRNGPCNYSVDYKASTALAVFHGHPALAASFGVVQYWPA